MPARNSTAGASFARCSKVWRRPRGSSLPAVIEEIVRDTDGVDVPASAEQTRPAEQLGDADAATLAQRIRRHGRDRRMLERLISRLDDALLEAVLRLLEPVH